MNNLFLSQFLSSKWAAEPVFLESFITQVSQLAVTEALAEIEVAAMPRTFTVVGDRAVINISGVLLKTVPDWLRFWGIEATGYDEIRAQLGNALAADSIESIHLQVSSPGGIIDGLADTADAIFAARKIKKITATVEDLSASAAYWLTSQAETVDAGRTAEVGSIGVYTVYLDSSKAAEDEGFKVVLIRSGEHKGMGIAGVEITDKQIEAVQENIDAMADQFVDSVARGRAKESGDIATLATGRLWIAAEAKKLGLIDRITNSSTRQDSKTIQSKGDKVMETETNVSTAGIDEAKTAAINDERARMSQLKTEFAEDPEFAVKAFTEGFTVDEAKASYCDVLREKLKEQTAGQKETKAEGAAPIASDDTDDEGAGDFLAEAREMAKEKKITVTAAMKRLQKKNPALHAAFIEKSKTEGEAMYAEAC